MNTCEEKLAELEQQIAKMRLEINRLEQERNNLKMSNQELRDQVRTLIARQEVFGATVNLEGTVQLVEGKMRRIEELEAIVDGILSALNVRENIAEERIQTTWQLVQNFKTELEQLYKLKEPSFLSRALVANIGAFGDDNYKSLQELREELYSLLVDGDKFKDTQSQIEALLFHILGHTRLADILEFTALIWSILSFYEGDGRVIAQDIIDELKAHRIPDIKLLEAILPYLRQTVRNCPSTAAQLQIDLVRYQRFLDDKYSQVAFSLRECISERQLRNNKTSYETIEAIAQAAKEVPAVWLPLPLQIARGTVK